MKYKRSLGTLLLAGVISFSSWTAGYAEPSLTESEYFDLLSEVLQDMKKPQPVSEEKRKELLKGLEDYIETHEAVKYASLELGKPYVYGAKGPEAFDCSGLMVHIFEKIGKKIPRTSAKQGEHGVMVAREELQTGDLVFFDTRSVVQRERSETLSEEEEFQAALFDLPTASESLSQQAINYKPERVTHVGIYVGEGKFIHAASEIRGVVVDSLKSKYYDSRYLFAKRYP